MVSNVATCHILPCSGSVSAEVGPVEPSYFVDMAVVWVVREGSIEHAKVTDTGSYRYVDARINLQCLYLLHLQSSRDMTDIEKSPTVYQVGDRMALSKR